MRARGWSVNIGFMTVQSHSLRRSHQELLKAAQRLAVVARDVRRAPIYDREAQLADVLLVLRDSVLPHIERDERLLYPEIERQLGASASAAHLDDDHLAIRDWIGRLTATKVEDDAELERLLYGLSALINVHVWKEERLYTGVLEALPWPSDG